MPVYEFEGRRPKIHPNAFVHPDAVIIGDVTIGAYSSVRPSAVLRGDIREIVIGERTSVQDNVSIHTEPEYPVYIGNEVTIGHNAMVHGAIVEDRAVIGIGAVVLDGAKIGEGAVVAAGALVPPGKEVPPNTLVMGIPAKPVREVDETLREAFMRGVKTYVEFVDRYKRGLKRIRFL